MAQIDFDQNEEIHSHNYSLRNYLGIFIEKNWRSKIGIANFMTPQLPNFAIEI